MALRQNQFQSSQPQLHWKDRIHKNRKEQLHNMYEFRAEHSHQYIMLKLHLIKTRYHDKHYILKEE